MLLAQHFFDRSRLLEPPSWTLFVRLLSGLSRPAPWLHSGLSVPLRSKTPSLCASSLPYRAPAEVRRLREDVLPASQSAFASFERGYRLGKFDLGRVLDAQETLFDARLQYVRALEACRRAAARVERTTESRPDAHSFHTGAASPLRSHTMRPARSVSSAISFLLPRIFCPPASTNPNLPS